MKWEEYKNRSVPAIHLNRVKTDIDCPKCGKKLYKRTDIVLLSYPPKEAFECDCGWAGTAYMYGMTPE